MTRRLFVRIVADLEREFDFFKQQWDARGVKGFSSLQKCTSAIRQLAYGSAADASDEYLRMSETTLRECLENFCQCIIHLYRRQYLRKPTANDIQAIYALHEQTHGLSGMLGSIDYKAPDSSFVVNDTHYKHGYYLTNGIYPEWSTFVKAFRWLMDKRWIEFKKHQESARKDIERTFAVLQDKWHVVKRPTRVVNVVRMRMEWYSSGKVVVKHWKADVTADVATGKGGMGGTEQECTVPRLVQHGSGPETGTSLLQRSIKGERRATVLKRDEARASIGVLESSNWTNSFVYCVKGIRGDHITCLCGLRSVGVANYLSGKTYSEVLREGMGRDLVNRKVPVMHVTLIEDMYDYTFIPLWQKKKRDEQYARLLKLFEQDDELELELGLRD
ncbi:hypothetical protein OSB04_030898 [Centaurea solstitialis]|uniref:Transposase n=1 Tax=Centaurea solstitialis TaxID=347529 RepID=A0AA38SL56_9ASTR|nr:hypothetical protein OSB04_030898 [Centaurea solstitialis]